MKYRRIFQMILVCRKRGVGSSDQKEKAGYAPRFNNTDIQDGGKCFARD